MRTDGCMTYFCSIRSRLLGLALAAVIPLAVLMTAALWIQWRSDRTAAAEHAVNEARLLAGQVDDHISALENLLSVLGQAVSFDPADRGANDALLRKVKGELPNGNSHILLFDVEGSNIGTSQDPNYPRPSAKDRAISARLWPITCPRSESILVEQTSDRQPCARSRMRRANTGRADVGGRSLPGHDEASRAACG